MSYEIRCIQRPGLEGRLAVRHLTYRGPGRSRTVLKFIVQLKFLLCQGRSRLESTTRNLTRLYLDGLWTQKRDPNTLGACLPDIYVDQKGREHACSQYIQGQSFRCQVKDAQSNRDQ
jgi:hypothetical protein